MPSNKPQLKTYTEKETIYKFKIIAAYNNKSMSNYLEQIVNECITKFEEEHGKITHIK